MDEINDFFDFSKKFERVTVPTGCLTGQTTTYYPQTSIDPRIVKREEKGNEYALEYSIAEKKRMMEEENVAAGPPSTYAESSMLSEMETLDDIDDDEDGIEDKKPGPTDDPVYDKYHFNMQWNDGLPIHDSHKEIIETIRQRRVVVLEGDTGCGKTTQVPQYILEDAYKRRERVNIIVTQPRRIAAISIARRVCSQRKWEEGSIIGYQVGLHANMSEDTRLLYCTTGVLLQKLIKEKSLRNYTHIILDEVHERDQDMDFLLIVIRRLMMTNSRNVKVILMSATINTGEFADYFRFGRTPAPVIKVDSRRNFVVKEHYLCELSRINNNVQIDYEEPGISNEMYQLALKLIIVIENIESHESSNNPNQKTSILIFLPGINEIDRMDKKLETIQNMQGSGVKLMPIRLHSMISPDEQQKIFHRAPPGHRKVILATNIAESSITVPDVKYVIDFCLTKSLITDTSTNFTSLQLHWASRANCRQRAGRAGRVMNGRVYRMISKQFYLNYLDEFGIPEMVRCPLETLVLKAKLLDMEPPPVILALAMTPPNLSDVHNTILVLKEVGALYKTVNAKYSIQDGDLSFVGRVMAALPLDIRVSRLIIFGYIYSVLEEAIIIAAGLSVKSIFTFSDKKRGELAAYSQKLAWADASGSDLFAILKAYRVWCTMREQHNMNEESGEYTWADRYFINIRSMKEMHLLVMELKERLEGLGIKETTAYQRIHWLDREKTIILKIVIAGAFYPYYFLRSNLNNSEAERSTYHTIFGHDPCSTVYFNNFNTKHIGQLYSKSIKDLFKQARIHPKNIDVRFQPGSEKVLVTFKSDPEDEYGGESSNRVQVPGSVRLEVYKAIKMRHLKLPTVIKVMDARSGINYAEERGIGVMFEGTWIPTKKQIKNPELVVIPNVFTKQTRGYLTHIEHCGKFYFQPLTEMERLKEITALLNCPEADERKFRNASAVSKGMLLAAPFQNQYYRAKVVQVIHSSRQHLEFRVLFIDFGNTSVVNFTELRRLSFEAEYLIDIPPRVYECCLAMVQPSSVRSPSGKWLDEAMEYMQEVADTGVVELEVYSVVNSVTSVIIKVGNSTVNDILVEKGLARKSDENFMSKTDHDLRMRKQSVAERIMQEDFSKQNEEYLRSIQPEVDLEIDPPPPELCLNNIFLRGPFSPLEAKIFSATRVGAWKGVHVERESVNSILVDADPQDVHERLIVAAGVSESVDRSSLTARQTTLMPNIHGFASLMTLIFCPTMQIHRNSSKSKYVSILAGLGHDENYKSLFEEHDMVLHLDSEILTSDLELINQIRYSMDTILYTDPGDDKPTVSPNIRADLAAKIKSLIIKLLSKTRKYIETHVDSQDHIWVRPDEKDVIESPLIYGPRCIFPMHSALRLYDESFDRMHALNVHCRELHRMKQFDGSVVAITCQLCDQTLENIVHLRIHLLSQLHRDREYQINFKAPH
ncbi:probable ATP-dependent RNA helicase spindle-E [Eupeodes corollae]|uniref:probable ATP-dependent RNA helicase spindle-E n=1 Tax=Eupeodes corollae TaxID=290404 RepID=UPI0024910C10|nr:probable ATP-dependent RNA helicase spindle-E [Eupeodes corollae]